MLWDQIVIIRTRVYYTGIKSFSFFCWTLCIVGQKVSTKSWMTAISMSPLREYCYYLVQSSKIRVKGDKMKKENNPIRLPFETWCSLSVPQCVASNKGNWNSWCLYIHNIPPRLEFLSSISPNFHTIDLAKNKNEWVRNKMAITNK